LEIFIWTTYVVVPVSPVSTAFEVWGKIILLLKSPWQNLIMQWGLAVQCCIDHF